MIGQRDSPLISERCRFNRSNFYYGNDCIDRGPGRPCVSNDSDDKKPEKRSAANFVPDKRSLKTLRDAAANCQGCDLYKNATQTVFGEGPRNAQIVLVGEQPGDQEDRQGHPFVGPAGRLLDRALEAAGIARDTVYVTNAVKHFSWTQRGKRRMHKRPREGQIDACNPWLAAELKVIKPRVVVCLGASAARAVFGKTVRVADYRGTFVETPLAPIVFFTVHPSSILRLDESARAREFARFVADLKLLRKWLESKKE
jgi:uracil-DNA glycosylase